MKEFKKNYKSTKHLVADIKKCRACWACVNTCPTHIISKVGFLWHKHIKLNNIEKCAGCFKCMSVCPCDVFTKNTTLNKK